MASVAPRLDRAESVIAWAHDTLGLTYEEIGGTIGATGRTVLRWRDRRHAPQRRNEAQIEKLDELRFWLETVFAEDREAADAWLRTRLLELRGKTPLVMVKRSDLDAVIEMLATYEVGAFV